MIQIQFKNMQKSEILRDSVHDRIQDLVFKFSELNRSRIMVTLEMHNSPLKPGPDLFSVKLHISGGRYSGVTVGKSDANLYVALADVVDHMLEKLNRFGDRRRVMRRNKERKWIDRALRPFPAA